METARDTSQENPLTEQEESLPTTLAPQENGTPVLIEPDLDFIRSLRKQSGDSFEKCFQCGTCSATCSVSPDPEPFPRKEMAWATWGMKKSLLEDPDVWLCFQCNDCSTRCPRGARPGEMLSAVRRESVIHHSFPRFLARWVNQPQSIPLLLGIPVALLTIALFIRDPIGNALGLSSDMGERIVYSYSNLFPHWLLNSFFLFFGILVSIAAITGVVRFWRALKNAATKKGITVPAKGILPSIAAALKSIITHDDFPSCTRSHSRFYSHLFVFFGFIALSLVTIWVITAKYNPLVQGNFIYPFGFWNPWKMLANAGGVAILAGCFLMIRDRFQNEELIGPGTFFDWAFISTLLAVVLTGFATEILHYVRLEPHRHIAYFVHLVFAFALLIYLPYSKFAHVIYRTTAIVYAEHSGRKNGARQVQQAERKNSGSTLLPVIVILIILIPIGYSVIHRVTAQPVDAPEVFLERPDSTYKECVKETDYMRYHHWELLRGIREEIVRYGKRGDVGLSGCKDCHTNRERFCTQCHSAVSMTPDCWGCHYYP